MYGLTQTTAPQGGWGRPYLLFLALLLHGGGLCVFLDVGNRFSLHFELFGSCQLSLLRQVFDLQEGREGKER